MIKAARQQHAETDVHQLAAERIVKQNAGVARIHQVEQHHHHHRQRAQNPSGQSSLGGLHLDFPLNPQSFSNDEDGAIQNLDQVAAGILLHQDGGHQYPQVGRGHAIQKLHQRIAHGQAKVLLFENFAEFRGRRFLRILGQHFHGAYHGMAGAQSAGQHVNGFRQNSVEGVDSARPLEGKNSVRQQPSATPPQCRSAPSTRKTT